VPNYYALKLPKERSDELEKPLRRSPDEVLDSRLESEVELKRLSL